MKLRRLILIILLLFGLTPLTLALLINVPLVMERIEGFYHKAHLQNLRADFRDLDQHLAGRYDTVRLLAKLPESPMLLGSGMSEEATKIHFIQWVNRVLQDQRDIVEIAYYDTLHQEHFSLQRNAETGALESLGTAIQPPSKDFLDAALKLSPGGALISRLLVNPDLLQEQPNHFMTLQLISPVFSPYLPRDVTGEPLVGAVAITIDVGGLARAYENTLWVHDDGRYLAVSPKGQSKTTAFEDFPGLQQLLDKGVMTLWTGPGQAQVIWIPMFNTESEGRLWVGREVDPSPIEAFRTTILTSLFGIMVGVIIMVFGAAHWLATRTEHFSSELTDGIGQVLKNNKEVEFSWGGTQELRDLGTNLTQLAGTHAEHTRRLERHARELEESNRYKSQFLANVSHELRTPLNSILLLSKMLAAPDARLDGEQRKQAQVIHSAGQDLYALINNILDLSRIEAGKCTFTVEQVPLRVMLQDLFDLLQPIAKNKHLPFKLDISDDLPEQMTTDGEKVRQILKNFLSNAIKFTREGSVTLQARYEPDQTKCALRFSVIDTGTGIPQEKQDAIFEAFQQADGSTNRRFGGTGLGLTISRSLADLLGGQIELSSVEGQGSTFSLRLPLDFDTSLHATDHIDIIQAEDSEDSPDTTKAAETEEKANCPPPSEPIDANYAGKRLLVIDADIQNLLALTPMLEGWNIAVTAAGDSKEALETLEDEPDFDLILIDSMMPGMDGYAILTALRTDARYQARYAATPVLVLDDQISNATSEDDRAQCLDAGANGYLSKPVEPATLKQELDRLL